MALRYQTTATAASSRIVPFQRSGVQRRSANVLVRLSSTRSWQTSVAGRLVVRAANEVAGDSKEAGGSGDILPSGEWPENFSLLNYEDLTKHYEPVLFKPEAQPNKILAEVMSKIMLIAFPDQALEEVDRHFSEISGLPVVDGDNRCVGVLSRKDRSKASDLKAKVKDVMSSPAITLSADKSVSDAAVLMLKNKIHRIPVVNDEQQVVGIVTRTDIFTALEGGA
ncbi:hypothetical protein M758_3G264400 [Ceratodon purpureus]|uniref:CBS domain-containing protein n=1 Tax=Ceratodon purpureus TaxID=3225 RepID=A0A8T0IRB1_CERPU|nr:hypothetical protein KC19_3G263600 [Ceratodon purpureus]KAG0624653.1 hypothetical protein M758_3G264400 [Ceratodon purpureus]